MIKKINFKFLLIAIIHFIITFFTDKIIIYPNNLRVYNYITCKVILLIILILLWQFIAKVVKRDKNNLSYLKNFLLYTIPILLLLFILWPGTWYGTDVYSFYGMAVNAEYLYYLNYLSSVFYIVSYMIFPCTSGAIILLAIIFGIVYSYVIKNLFDIYKTKLVYLFSIPFVLMHTLFYVFYANRPIMFGIFYLLLICILLIDYLKKQNLTVKKLIVISILTAIVGYWRSESIYLIIAIPIFVFIVYKQKINIKNILKIFGSCVIAFIIVSAPQKIYEYQTKTDTPSSRNLPMYVAPLSYMLTYDLDGKNIEEDLEIVDKVLDIEIMKKYASFYDTPSVWSEGGCIKNYTKEEYEEFKKAYFRIIKNNFWLFLKTKTFTFAAAAGYKGDYFTTMDLYTENNQTIMERKDTESIVGYKVRRFAYSIIEGKTGFSLYDKFHLFTQNLLIPILFIFIFFIYSIIKKKLFYFLLSGMLLGHVVLVYLTAPAAYFMYYFNIYLCGWLLGIFMLFKFINYKKKKIKKEK